MLRFETDSLQIFLMQSSLKTLHFEIIVKDSTINYIFSFNINLLIFIERTGISRIEPGTLRVKSTNYVNKSKLG